MAKVTWVGWIGMSVVVVACGKSEGGPAPVSLEQLPARVAAMMCEGRGGCCERSGFTFDVAGCKQERVAEIEQELVELDTANVDYDATAAGECLEALEAGSSCGEFDGDDAEACDRVFRGKLAPGQPCTSSQECRREPGQSVSCYSEDGIQPELCTVFDGGMPSRHGKLGEACFTTCFENDDCSGSAAVPAPGPGVPAPADPAACYRSDGLWCDYSRASPTCARLLPLGQACTGYESCAGKAFCATDTSVCSAPRANGQPCSADRECQSGNCSDTPPAAGPTVSEAVCVAEERLTADECTLESEEVVPAPQPGGNPGSTPPAP